MRFAPYDRFAAMWVPETAARQISTPGPDIPAAVVVNVSGDGDVTINGQVFPISPGRTSITTATDSAALEIETSRRGVIHRVGVRGRGDRMPVDRMHFYRWVRTYWRAGVAVGRVHSWSSKEVERQESFHEFVGHSMDSHWRQADVGEWGLVHDLAPAAQITQAVYQTLVNTIELSERDPSPGGPGGNQGQGGGSRP